MVAFKTGTRCRVFVSFIAVETWFQLQYDLRSAVEYFGIRAVFSDVKCLDAICAHMWECDMMIH